MVCEQIIENVRALIVPIVEEEGLYLENIALKRAGKYSTLIVTIDLPCGAGAVGSEQLEKISREISAVLDSADPISGMYTLEVSTPGVERRLDNKRHYSRGIGRMIRWVLADGTQCEGRLLALLAGDGQDIDSTDLNAVEYAEAVRVLLYGEKNKQRVQLGERTITFDEIASARIVVEL